METEGLVEKKDLKKDSAQQEVEKFTPYIGFNLAIVSIIETLNKKNHDYAREQVSEFDNFVQASIHAGISTEEVIECLIGIKDARLRSFRDESKRPKNEPILDTYKDRAVYALIAYAWQLQR